MAERKSVLGKEATIKENSGIFLPWFMKQVSAEKKAKGL